MVLRNRNIFNPRPLFEEDFKQFLKEYAYNKQFNRNMSIAVRNQAKIKKIG
jgi:hypothetical protein